MGITSLDWASIIVYLLIMVGIAVFFSRFMVGAKDFFAGGRQIPWWVAGISLYMGLFSAWTFSGGASLVYRTGWYGIMYFATWPIGFIIGFALAAVRCRRSRVISPIEYIETRFNRATHTTLSIIFAVSLLYWPVQHMASLGKMIGPTLFPGIDSGTAMTGTIIVIAVLILFYTYSGGLWAVSITDAVQSFLLLAIVIILVGLTCIKNPGILGQLPAFDITPENEPLYGPGFLFAYILQGVFSAAMGDRAQRYYSVRDEKAVIKCGITATALFCTGPILFGLVPLIASVIWPDPSMIPGFAGVKNPQEGVFIAMAVQYLPPGILGMFVASMLAATMSATDTCWNTASAIVSVDLYKGLVKRDATDRQVMNAGRIAIIVFFFVALAGALAIVLRGVKLDIIGITIGLLTGFAVTIPLTLGLVVRNVSKWAGVGAVVMGSLAAIVSSDLSLLGPLKTLGFLKLTFGDRMYFIAAITLAIFLLSLPMGRFARNKLATITLSAAISVGLWFFFIFVNGNPLISWGILTGAVAPDPELGSPTPYLWAMHIAALAFGYLFYLFSNIYNRDLDKPEPEVDEFFRLIKTPVDADKEVGPAHQTATVYPFVGMIVIGLAAMSLLMLLFPEGRSNPMVNVVLAAMLSATGFGIMQGGKGLAQSIKESTGSQEAGK